MSGILSNKYRLFCLCLLALPLLACLTNPVPQNRQQAAVEQPGFTENNLSLDAAIAAAASHFIQRLPAGAKIALVHFDAPTGRLADYIFEELWGHIEDSNSFVMVDRRNLDRIETEIRYQLGSGRVDDNLAASISRQYGAEVLVFGQIVSLGQDFRMTVYATDVERAASIQRAFNIRPDNRLTSLLNVSLDEEVDRAVAVMARAVDQRTTIAVGRISFGNTQTVSSLSAWLNGRIITGAQGHRERFLVASENESADFAVLSRGFTTEAPLTGSSIQAVVTGSYSPLDSGAEVLLWLVSTSGNRPVLASSRFVIPASELDRRRLSLLPERGDTAISRAEFDAKQETVAPFAGRNNRWAFTVTPDVLGGIYRDGDFMTMRLFSERAGYFRLIHVDVYGNIQVIYPISPRDNNFIRAGETRRIPDTTHFLLGPPFGEELILATIYERPFRQDHLTGPLSMGGVTRGLTVISETQAEMDPSATAMFTYTILPR